MEKKMKAAAIVISGPNSVQWIAYGATSKIEAIKDFEKNVHVFPDVPTTEEEWDKALADLESEDEYAFSFKDVSAHTARKIEYLIQNGRLSPKVLNY